MCASALRDVVLEAALLWGVQGLAGEQVRAVLRHAAVLEHEELRRDVEGGRVALPGIPPRAGEDLG